MAKERNVIFLFGNDEYAIARRIKEYEKDFPNPSAAGMNTAWLDGRSSTDEELNNAVNVQPFLADRRLVILSNPSVRYTSPDARRKCFEFLEKTPATARLVLYESIEPKDVEKHWLVRWALKNNTRVDSQAFMLPRKEAMAGWISREVGSQGGRIDAAAAVKLAEMVGVDTRQAAQEIAKLLAYTNWSGQISAKDVEAVSIVSAEQSVFDFVDSLAGGDGKKAQVLLKRLFETEDPFSLWGMVIRQFRLLLQAREIMDGKGTKDDVARHLNLHPYVVEKASAQARQLSIESLELIHHKLLEIDEGVKIGRFTLDFALEMLVIELAGS